MAALSRHFEGELLRPGDHGFDEAASIWNGAVECRPALVARCASSDDVSAAVRFAAKNDVLVAVKGGGHNVAGSATCNGGMVIDLSPMNDVRVDPAARRARAGGGATWADVDRATQPFGLAAPGGLVSRTGIAGLTLGGGLGWLRRKWGLSCDNLASVEIVTADGSVVTASGKQNKDLFWAVRGGGGNFGVVTEFEYVLHPVGPEIMFCFVLYPAADGRQVLRGWRGFCDTAPDEVSSIVLCGTVPAEESFPEDIHGHQFVAIAALHCGTVEEGHPMLQPLRELANPLCDFSGPAPYVEVQSMFDQDYPDGLRYYWKSLFLDRFDDEAIDVLLELAAERPSPLSTVDIWQLGGAMASVGPKETAFGSRGSPYLLGAESNWEDRQEDEANRNWARDACDRMAKFASGASYSNFEPDIEASGCFDQAHLQRLAELKRRYDHGNLFRLNHNIQPG
ncbi:FAD-binding oxidoreductase [Nitratireductor luteus]|uniref:FAD-binding oxidoreductase n=1 Tax=Nitratireductor luteus TaxID=2976980 RepID=UPI00223E9485